MIDKGVVQRKETNLFLTVDDGRQTVAVLR